MHKILVPIKRVPDYEIRVRLAADGSGILTDGIKWVINPFDEIALEEAIRIKEGREEVQEIVVVSIGPEGAAEQLRKALAMGADRAILVLTNDYIDSHLASSVIAAVHRRDSYSLVLIGKQAVDSDANQTGQLLSSELNIAQAACASKVEIDSSWGSAVVGREVDGGLQVERVLLPAVITADLRLNEPRYPSLPGIIKAKKKPLEEIPLVDLAIDPTPRVRVLAMTALPRRKGGTRVNSVAQLVEKLKNEAKVI